MAQAVAETMIQVTVKIPESVWQRAKIEAIRQKATLGQVVQASLESTLPEDRAALAPSKKDKS